jgi:hypothetical protein
MNAMAGNPYRIIYSDMWCLASYDCQAATPEDALAKANGHFGERVTSWYKGGDPLILAQDKLNGYPWKDGREYYSTSPY